jgi:hypothetical protein
MRRQQNGIGSDSAQDVQMNLDALIALKTKLNGDVNWNDVAPETDGLDHLKQKHKADREREALGSY